MTQLTQSQWYDKIKASLPGWFLQKDRTARAVLMAIAGCCEQLQEAGQQHVDDTFLSNAEEGVLTTHGGERSIARLSSAVESDADYRVRVRTLANTSTIPGLLSALQQILVTGTPEILEDYTDTRNAFTVEIPVQRFSARSFCDREDFADRDTFTGTAESATVVIDSIRELITTSRALGTIYRVVDSNGVLIE